MVIRRQRFWALAALTIAVAGLAMTTPATAQTVAGSAITIDANGPGRTFDGVGAILGGGDNDRYLADYPAAERARILDDLFKPDYGASLQLLKLEIGGDDGGEASVEPAEGEVSCDAGYGLSIARQAVAIDPHLRLYGLQWSAPGWVGDGANSIFTGNDIRYLLDWLGCARKYGLRIDYLGGWNESDNGFHAPWYRSLRSALDAHGYASTQLVAADSYPEHGGGYNPASTWRYTSSPAVSILGAHDDCGVPTGGKGAATRCSSTAAARDSGKPVWLSEVGAMDAGDQPGCRMPCAPAMDRVLTRGYVDARMTGYLEWPLLDAMPPDLPEENRGLVTADQPWSGSYSVDAMTWAIAQLTQFAQPGWTYLNAASGYLRHDRADGSYVTLVNPGRNQWTTMIETTAGPARSQKASFTVTGGHGLATKTVHVWASDFNQDTGTPARWFVRHPDLHPSQAGKFTMTVEPGFVYTLSTTVGQTRRAATGAIPAPASLTLPYANALNSSHNAGSTDSETSLLASVYGSFEVRPCDVADGQRTECTEQSTPQRPVLWAPKAPLASFYPYAILGSAAWAGYTVSCDVLLSQPGTSAGVVARFSARTQSASGLAGYILDVQDTGAWAIDRGNRSGGVTTLVSGQVSTLGAGTWHKLSLTVSGDQLAATIDGVAVGSATDETYQAGPVGLEAGLGSGNWPRAQYSDLTVVPAA